MKLIDVLEFNHIVGGIYSCYCGSENMCSKNISGLLGPGAKCSSSGTAHPYTIYNEGTVNLTLWCNGVLKGTVSPEDHRLSCIAGEDVLINCIYDGSDNGCWIRCC